MAKKHRTPRPLKNGSTPAGPALEPLQQYVLLVTMDPDGAAELFAPDAIYRCQIRGQSARLVGRAAIRAHLAHTRPDLEYSVTFFRQHPGDDCAMAEITIDAPDWGKVTETVLVRMVGDLIAEFEILAW